MPQMANITVKKYDGTTDVTYTAVIASAGDKTSAKWENATVGGTRAARPTFQLRAESNGAGTARRVHGIFVWPITVTDSVTGQIKVTGNMNASVNCLVPQNQTEAEIKEQCAQFANVLASALIKQSMIDGYAPI